MKATRSEYILKFKQPAITSRNTLHVKPTWFLTIETDELPGGVAVGEVAMFAGLSREDNPAFVDTLNLCCNNISLCNSLSEAYATLPKISSIRFGFESALLRAWAAHRSSNHISTLLTPWLPSSRSDRWKENASRWLDGRNGIRINGLIWMGDKTIMRRRIREKLDAGFHCIKLKIGGINFEDELQLLQAIRREFSADVIELRLDANGAFTPENALERLCRLAEFDIHSIEQPIKPGQFACLSELCRLSPIPIALDEELIGFSDFQTKQLILNTIQPQYIILKPSLCGGFAQAEEWIAEAEKRNIGWWTTSALESNIGLEALAIWTAGFNPSMPQGLGTGGLYTNNLPLYLRMEGERLISNSAEGCSDLNI